jgi:hypothetical protein
MAGLKKREDVALRRFPGSFLKRSWPHAASALAAALILATMPAQAAESVKIYRSTMPDGSVMLSDKPSAGAKAVVSDTYVLKAPSGAADAERDYWRRQSEAFNLRQQQRDLDAARSDGGQRRMRGRNAPDDQPVAYYNLASSSTYRPFAPSYRMGHRDKPVETWDNRRSGAYSGSGSGSNNIGASPSGSGSSFPRPALPGPSFPR